MELQQINSRYEFTVTMTTEAEVKVSRIQIGKPTFTPVKVLELFFKLYGKHLEKVLRYPNTKCDISNLERRNNSVIITVSYIVNRRHDKRTDSSYLLANLNNTLNSIFVRGQIPRNLQRVILTSENNFSNVLNTLFLCKDETDCETEVENLKTISENELRNIKLNEQDRKSFVGKIFNKKYILKTDPSVGFMYPLKITEIKIEEKGLMKFRKSRVSKSSVRKSRKSRKVKSSVRKSRKSRKVKSSVRKSRKSRKVKSSVRKSRKSRIGKTTKN